MPSSLVLHPVRISFEAWDAGAKNMVVYVELVKRQLSGKAYGLLNFKGTGRIVDVITAL